MRATASEAVHLGIGSRLTRPDGAVAERGEAGVHANGHIRRWRWATVLTDSVGLLGLVWSIPLAMALVGTPIALAIALLLWLYRLAFSAA
jgi:hypothetical protein